MRACVPQASPVPVVVGISNVQVFGSVRVTLAPLLPVVPGFACVSVCFLKPPYVDVRLEGVGKQLALIPGLEAFLLGFVDKLVANLMLLPRKMTFSVVPGRLEDLVPQARGVLRVHVINATGLPQVTLWISTIVN